MEIKIDGQTIVLTPAQAEQFRKAVLKETSVPKPKYHGNIIFSCKPDGKDGNYPLVISSIYPVGKTWGASYNAMGYDFSLVCLKSFIIELKKYAAQIWTTAEEELKKV